MVWKSFFLGTYLQTPTLSFMRVYQLLGMVSILWAAKTLISPRILLTIFALVPAVMSTYGIKI